MAKADAILTQLITERRVPGLGISVLKQGKVIYQRGYGYSDVSTKTPADPRSTIFRIASISKPIAATALAIMCTEGIIDLDASFYNYVPYYPKKKHDFSIRQLASHTAGIRGYRGKEYALNKAYSIKDSIEIFKDDPLLFVPGEQYLYNSYGWVLISLAMQEASGIAFEEYVKSRVLEPLQMLHTQPEIPNALPANLANFYTGYSSGFKKATTVDNRYKLAGGGYLSTCEDIARLGQAYLDGKVLDHLTRKEFLNPINYNNTPAWYGLGWEVSEDAFGRPFYGHTGNGIGVHSRFYVYPEEQMVFSILINCTNPEVDKALDEVINAMLKRSI
ncbi:serine hydrolase domain-containing protein [Muriicola sp. Z0-33]|uniref:serine hydrolase domain-containing protein n=1 Tax=Muriicola sp. Z0-33 TaxID=2816957 RepID=UPI0022382DD4|nr:serine hydrolase domain-containing protein [Muriicola sp. Z0-33]